MPENQKQCLPENYTKRVVMSLSAATVLTKHIYDCGISTGLKACWCSAGVREVVGRGGGAGRGNGVCGEGGSE